MADKLRLDLTPHWLKYRMDEIRVIDSQTGVELPFEWVDALTVEVEARYAERAAPRYLPKPRVRD